MVINIANFVIFDEDDTFYILKEFEIDRISPRESPKNGRIGSYGLNCKIFVNSELIFGTHDENYPMKKNSCLSDHLEIFVTQPGRFLLIRHDKPIKHKIEFRV